MERFEQIIETYYKANDGKKFRTEDECIFWETMKEKYLNDARHRVVENADGVKIHFFYINNPTEAHEVRRLCHTYLHRGLGIPNGFPEQPGWVCCGDDWYDYDDVPVMMSIDDYINNLMETIVNYKTELNDVKAIKDEVTE